MHVVIANPAQKGEQIVEVHAEVPQGRCVFTDPLATGRLLLLVGESVQGANGEGRLSTRDRVGSGIISGWQLDPEAFGQGMTNLGRRFITHYSRGTRRTGQITNELKGKASRGLSVTREKEKRGIKREKGRRGRQKERPERDYIEYCSISTDLTEASEAVAFDVIGN